LSYAKTTIADSDQPAGLFNFGMTKVVQFVHVARVHFYDSPWCYVVMAKYSISHGSLMFWEPDSYEHRGCDREDEFWENGEWIKKEEYHNGPRL
jgi:hypothetical protein